MLAVPFSIRTTGAQLVDAVNAVAARAELEQPVLDVLCQAVGPRNAVWVDARGRVEVRRR